MIEGLGAQVITILMIASLLVGVFTGYSLGIVVGAVGLIFGLLLFGPSVYQMIYARAVDGMLLNYTFLAVPLFIFMGLMLERSGIATGLYDALYLWLGGFRGGLAIVTILIGTIMAATVGIIAASIAMLAIVALPSMVKRGYDKGLASGSVCAGGCLGILIPPSVMLVLYGPVAQLSVGKLFFAAFMPGFLLSTLYCAYIAIRSLLQPSCAPSVPAGERNIPFTVKTRMLLKSLLPPTLLILSVLGVIFFGIAPPTEAAGVGAFAATLLVAAYRKLSFQVLKEVTTEVLRIVGLIALVVMMALVFVGVFIGAGGGDVAKEVILAAPGGRWGSFAVIMLMVFLLGFVMDWIGIVFLLVPIVTPIGLALGFDPLWFAMMICVNFQMAFMTPPFAPGIFWVQGTAPKELGLTLGDIIRGVLPFVILIVIGLGLLIAFPEIILWLPGKMIR